VSDRAKLVFQHEKKWISLSVDQAKALPFYGARNLIILLATCFALLAMWSICNLYENHPLRSLFSYSDLNVDGPFDQFAYFSYALVLAWSKAFIAGSLAFGLMRHCNWVINLSIFYWCISIIGGLNEIVDLDAYPIWASYPEDQVVIENVMINLFKQNQSVWEGFYVIESSIITATVLTTIISKSINVTTRLRAKTRWLEKLAIKQDFKHQDN